MHQVVVALISVLFPAAVFSQVSYEPPVCPESIPNDPPPAVTVDRAYFAADVKNKQPVGYYSGRAPSEKPLFLWTRLLGWENAYCWLIRRDKLPLQHKWRRFKFGEVQSEELITLDETSPDVIARQRSLLDELKKKKGSFDWRVWSKKSRFLPGEYIVEILYNGGEFVSCRVDGTEQPCRYKISIR